MPHIKGNPVKKAPDLGLRGLELLDKIIEIIEEHPEHWNQETWAEISDVPGLGYFWNQERDGDAVPESCGTAMCIAGWAAHLCGAELRWRVETTMNDDGDEEFYLGSSELSLTGGLGYESISGFAQKVLGLTRDQAYELFSAVNDLDQIKWQRDVIQRQAERNRRLELDA